MLGGFVEEFFDTFTIAGGYLFGSVVFDFVSLGFGTSDYAILSQIFKRKIFDLIPDQFLSDAILN